MGKRILWGIAALALTCAMAINASASELDILVDKLVEKGVLNPTEAQIILDETKAQVAQELVEGKAVSAPAWTQKINIKQDVRARYQYQEKVTDAVHRDRGRVRYRLGVDANISPNFKAGAGLATGNDDPRSTNQTMENDFQHSDIRLDYAFGQYKIGDFSAIGGKFKFPDYLYTATDMLWDTDINPEGASMNYILSLGSDGDFFQNAGLWIIDETSGSEDDPYVWYYQGGVNYAMDAFDLKVAGAYFGFQGLEDLNWSTAFPTNYSSSTNTRTGNKLVYDYNAINIGGEFGWNAAGEGPVVPRAAIVWDYVNNLDGDVDEDTGWSIGGYVGHKKVSDKGSWQVKYLYTKLEKDAWVDAYPDSDRYGGGTDVKGSEVILEYGLAKNVSIGLDYYQFDKIRATSNTERLLQADVNFKF